MLLCLSVVLPCPSKARPISKGLGVVYRILCIHTSTCNIHIHFLCRSIKKLKKLQRLDVGNNEIESLVI